MFDRAERIGLDWTSVAVIRKNKILLLDILPLFKNLKLAI